LQNRVRVLVEISLPFLQELSLEEPDEGFEEGARYIDNYAEGGDHVDRTDCPCMFCRR